MTRNDEKICLATALKVGNAFMNAFGRYNFIWKMVKNLHMKYKFRYILTEKLPPVVLGWDGYVKVCFSGLQKKRIEVDQKCICFNIITKKRQILRISNLQFITSIDCLPSRPSDPPDLRPSRSSTGWPFRLIQTSCWHQSNICVLVHGPLTKTELLFWCKGEVLINLNDHPVLRAHHHETHCHSATFFRHLVTVDTRPPVLRHEFKIATTETSKEFRSRWGMLH